MIEAEWHSIQQHLELALQAIEDLEHMLGLSHRWRPENPEYVEVNKYIQNREFIRAVDELEGLVVKRLIKLDKVNLSGTGNCSICDTIYSYELAPPGYKLHRHISQAITRCSVAVRQALEKYNKLAPTQNPPRSTLKYSEVAEYGWLGEFSLLKDSRHAILDKPWSLPLNCQMAIKYFKLVRSREEIQWCNVEIGCLQAWINFEDTYVPTKVEKLSTGDPLLTAHILDLHRAQQRWNDCHWEHLLQIS